MQQFASVLADTTGQWMWAANADGEISDDLMAGLHFTGQRYEDLLHSGWAEPLHPDDRERARLEWRNAVATGKPFENLQRVRRADGDYRYVMVRAMPVRDARGVVRDWVGTSVDITDRMQLEREATERAGQFEAIFNAMADGVLVYDAQGAIIRANHAARALMGYDRDAHFYERPAEDRAAQYTLSDANGRVVPPDDLPPKRILSGEVLTGTRSEDYHVHTLDGRDVLLNLSGAPVRVEDGRIVGAVIVMRDVEARRQLEREREDQAREIAGVIEGIPDGVVVYGPDSEIRFMNSSFRSLLALDENELKQPFAARGVAIAPRDSSTGEPIPPEQWPSMRIQRGEVLVGSSSVDVVVRAHDGRDVYLNCVGAPIRDESGQVRGSVIVIRDVEARRRFERRTRETLAALLAMAETLVRPPTEGVPHPPSSRLVKGARRSEVAQRLAELTRDVLGCVRVGITVVEPETRLMRAVAVVGLAPEEEERWWEEQAALERQAVRLGDGADPDQLARFEAGEAFVIDMTKPPYDQLPNPYNITTSLVLPMRADQAVVGLLSLDFGGPFHEFTDEEKTLAGAVANLAAWVSERDRLLRDREAARAHMLALEQANQRLDEFLSVASHELRTPLTTIKMNVQIAARRAARLAAQMRDAGNDGASELEALESLLGRTDHAIRRQDLLVSDLLDASRMQSGKLQLRLELLDLPALVKDAVEEQRLAHPGRTISLSTTRRHVKVEADADRIRQVVANYLTNALKYSDAAAPVEVSANVDGTHVRVSVRDHGPGIAESERAQIWERFHQVGGIAPQSGSGIGLGLGLYISREIVDRHGGTVGLDSEVGSGSNFWFSLPIANATP